MACGCTNKAKIRAAVERKFREGGRSTDVNVANVVAQIRAKRLKRIAEVQKERKVMSFADVARSRGQ